MVETNSDAERFARTRILSAVPLSSSNEEPGWSLAIPGEELREYLPLDSSRVDRSGADLGARS
jgi:hypothetical protein